MAERHTGTRVKIMCADYHPDAILTYLETGDLLIGVGNVIDESLRRS
jgi:hypothetical protein